MFIATAEKSINLATLLFTGAVVDEILERASPRFIENEFLQDDVNKCVCMARSNMLMMNLAKDGSQR